MEIQPEVIDINNLDETPVINLNDGSSESVSIDSKPSVNFGDGIELLMNDKRKPDPNKKSDDININDLNDLENELNDLTDVVSQKAPSKSGLFNDALNTSGGIKLNFEDKTNDVISDTKTIDTKTTESVPIAKVTAEKSKDVNKNKTWDGFGKFNNVPLDPDKAVPAQPKLTADELLREKFKVLRNLEGLEKKGVKLTKKYNMDSSLQEMKGEYEMIMDEKEKSASCKFQGRMLMAAITGLEFLNNRFDPFDFKLDGWAEQLNENIDDYDEIFSELHEKYKSKATMAPELKLLFQLGGSAMMVHMTNTMFKSAMPGMDDIMRQNPELMQQFQSAAMNSMSQQNPGFGQFMGGIMGGPPQMGGGPMPPMGAPAVPPMEMRRNPPRMPRGGNRPDIAAGRGNDMNDAVNIKDNYERTRPEMKGPSDLGDILSGLKTKKINIGAKDSNSVVSVSELDEMKNELNKPKKSRRKPKSERNTVSLNFS